MSMKYEIELIINSGFSEHSIFKAPLSAGGEPLEFLSQLVGCIEGNKVFEWQENRYSECGPDEYKVEVRECGSELEAISFAKEYFHVTKTTG